MNRLHLASPVEPIAAQCCVVGSTGDAGCKRFITNDPTDCLGGPPEDVRPSTYFDNAAICAQRSTPDMPLEICDRSCAFQGCEYNLFPVITSKKCPSPSPPSLPSPSSIQIPEGGVAVLD